MTYLNLHITDGSNTGELVDPVAALSNNYDLIDAGITAMQALKQSSTVALANADTGQEVLAFDVTDPNDAIPLWVADSGGTWHKSDINETWSAWVNMTIAGSTPALSAVSFRTPQFRKSNFGRLEFRGALKPTAGVLTLNVWRLMFDGVVAADAIRLIANRPNSQIAIGSTLKFFRAVSASPPAGAAGTQTSCTICVTNDVTFTWMQIYYMFTDTSAAPANQTFELDGLIWDMAGANGYQGNTT